MLLQKFPLLTGYDAHTLGVLREYPCIHIGQIQHARLGAVQAQTAQLYSKELENSIGNVEAILDAAYTHSAFTDDKLLALLLN